MLQVYSGDGNPLIRGAFRLTFPDTGLTSGCVDFDAPPAGSTGSLEEVLAEVTGSDVRVSREAISSPGEGYEYRVTFIGAGVRGNVSSLAVDFGNCTGFAVKDGHSNRSTVLQQVVVTTDIDGGFLVPGEAYFFRVAAENAVGTGPTQAAAAPVRPRAPPGPPTAATVYAGPDDPSQLLVEFFESDTPNGAALTGYRVEYALAEDFDRNEAQWVWAANVTDISGPSPFAVNITNLTCGESYVVRVRGVNEMGIGGPSWYSSVGLDDGRVAVPTCFGFIEECEEQSNTSITARSLVHRPPFQLSLGNGLFSANPFTAESLFVTFQAPNVTAGCKSNNVSKWKVEWDTLPTFNSVKGAPLSFNASLGTSPEVFDAEDGAVGSGSFNITGEGGVHCQGTKGRVKIGAKDQ